MELNQILNALKKREISIEDAKDKLNKKVSQPNIYQDKPHDSDNKNYKEEKFYNIDSSKSESVYNDNDIAIVGISGRYPGSEDMISYWDNLSQGKNLIKEIPKERWDVDKYYNADDTKEINCKWMGYIDSIGDFDPSFFYISEKESASMDPQQRIFLEEGYKAFEDAGYNSNNLNNKKCGIYLGYTGSEYGNILSKKNSDYITITNNNSAIAAARIAYYLNLKGPAISIDTACSSSLVATHLAYEALINNEIEMALVGGVSLYIGPDRIITMCKEHMLSKSGVCKSFDNDADGFVPGEGVGALVLKRLKDAEKDHDNIYGVIAASGINQNGSTNGITAPSKASQIELEEQIYNKYRINPENITYAEMHGTATKMGDFIELEALSSVFCKKTNKKEYCAIGSVKSNIGHTSAVSGIASIQKVLLCMKNEKLVPTLNVKNKNSFFNFEQSPFYINTELKDWKIDNDSIRTSSVSSFGFSGCNAHLVLKEYIPEKPEFKEQTLNKSVIFVLSAKEQSQLYVYAESMKNFIDNNDIDLNNMAYTLQLGRDAMNYRIAFIVSSKMELSNALSNFIRNKYIEEKNDSQFCGCMNSEYEIDNNTIEVYIKENNLKMLADAWVKGVNIDWDKLYLDSKPYKISLPVYPFLNKNYWIGEINDNELEEVTEKIIESNYTVEKYNTNEPYFKEHKVNQVPVLIGMTHASLAINKFFDMYKDENSVLLSKLNFIEQVKLEKNEEVEIRIEPTQKDSKIDFKALYKFESEKEWRLTATGTLKKNVFQNQKKDIQELKNSMNVFNDFEKIYDINPAVQIGSIFRPITEFYIGKNKALSKVILNDELKKNDHNYILHPIVIYCAFQVVASLIGESNLKDGFLPFGISDITVKKDCNLDEFWIYVDLKKYSGELAVFDAQVIDNYGNVVAGFSRCFSKRLRPEKSSLNNMSLNLEKDSNISSSYIKSEISDINKSIEKYLINKLKPIMPNKNTVSTKVNLMDLGLESAQLVKLSEEIENDINIELTPAIFFEYPNIKLLTEFFVDEYKEAFIKALNINQNNNLEEEASFDIDNTKEYKYTDDILEDKKVDYSINEDIAIIGMSGIMPDGMDLEGFWQKIRRGENLIKEIPSDHWDYTKWYDPDMDSEGKTYCKWGSFIEDVDKFDPEFFNISPAEAEWIDPQLRLLLENIYSTGEDSGYINKLKGSNTGMFIGVCCHDYKDLINESYDNINPYVELGNSQTVLANRISFLFDINGPSMAIDTACSSSLVALHNACTAIKNKECDMAFVAGANLLLSPYHYRYFSSIKALSKTGLCHAFDEAADGYVPGEFIGSILLKPLKQAIKDNDHIHAVIKGSASLHGGYTPSFTAPSVEGEENVIVKAWENANIDPNTISYIEAHGTGTKLGDPIEINGLKKAFKRYSDKEHFCAIGSAKVNIGHTEGAAGIAGILKVIMQMKHNEIPPLPVTKGLNKYIKLNKSPLYINREVEEWTTQGDVPRRAGISSFGISGSYAHVVLEEYVNNSNINESEIEEGPVILVLSALNKERLKESAARLLKFICNDKSIALTNMAYTLQVGRKPMEERMGIIASSKDEIKESLKAFIEKDEILENVYYGNSNYNEMALDLIEDDDITKMVDSWISKRKYKNILKSWVNGINIDWLKLYSDKKPSIISLPSYPFAKQRCWIEERNRENSDIKIKECNKMINPLLHDNISNLYEMKFSILFTGNEFFLEDHKVNSNKILPGVSYIEMARAAIYEAMKPVMNDKMGIDFTNINWISPIMVNDKPIKTNIEIYAEDDDNLAYEIYTDDVLNSQGNAKLILIDEIQYLDLNQLKEVCIEHGLSKEKHYEVFANMGIEYGNSYKCVEKSYVGENKVLSKILLPESIIDTEQSYVLHPSVMDAALQTTINLIVDSQKLDEPMLPFAVDEVIVIDKCEKEMWAYTKQCYKEGNNEKVNKFDIDLFNNEGKVCVKIKGISSRKLEKQDKKTLNHLEESNTDFHEAEAKTTMMYPVWDVTSIEYYNKVDLKSNEKNVIVIGGNEKDKGYIQEVYPNSYYLNIESNDTINDIREKLQLCNSIDKVIWILPYKEIESMTDEYLIEGQEEGILPIFRTVKALISLEYDREDLDLTIITTQVQSINQYEKVNPAHSSVYGLVSSLAKEYSNWNIKIIDLESKCKWPISDMLRIPPDKKGDMWVYRKNQWYRQKLITIEDFKVEESKYKENGVYVVIGGAGGIGEAFSEYVIKKYNAQVVWIGRRPIDENIQNKIDKLMKIGPKPYYIRADASNKDAMIKAYERIKEKFLNINGVIHAAIDLLDKSITNMNEDRLRAGLIAKINASVRIAQVFGNENLDFIMFFSSVISFIKGAGQSNYAAGCIFKDNFAHQLSLKLPNKVKIVNWGYFGKVGVVSSKEYQQRMLRIGVGSIEIPEAMETLEKLLSSPIDQIAFVKTINQQESDERKNEEKIIFDNSNEKISLLANENKLNDSLDVNTSLAILNEEKEVYDVSYRLLLSQIEPYFEPGNKGKIIKLYNRWFEESIRTLKENDYIRDSEGSYVLNYPHKDIEKLWEEWNEKKEKWLNNINLKAKVILLEKMLKSLSQIITGKIKSTDIMFPNSSMELLTGVYRDNEIADYVNEVLADKIVEYIEKRISNDPDAKIKILEIGAGTGGTSSIVLKRINQYEKNIKEYCYTDVSRAFLIYGENKFKEENPYLNFKIFNVEEPVSNQNIKEKEYDLVIAANVLHATKNIHYTLRNIKMIMKNNGMIMLNEIINNSLFAHLTFGLLEGWWIYEDSQIRLPGCPGLSFEFWKKSFEDEGFKNVFSVIPSCFKLDQQVIVALSNGVIRKETVLNERIISVNNELKKEMNLEKSNTMINKTNVNINRLISNELLKEKTIEYLKTTISNILKVAAEKINPSSYFNDYGIDSILIIQLTNVLRKKFKKITSTVFFEYETIDSLSDYLIDNNKEELISALNFEDTQSVKSINTPKAENYNESREFKTVPIKLDGTGNLFRRRNKRFKSSSENKAVEVKRKDEVNIAIIGVSGRYPNAENVSEFWDNLKKGKNCITTIPEERWNWKTYFSEKRGQEGKMYSRWGGFIKDIDKFDPLFFKISPAEAEKMDPQERVFLETAYESIEDSGYTPSTLSSNKKVGIFVGVMNGNYATGSKYWSIANRVSYTLDFQGPSLAVDTACSSSLTAVHLAVESLKNGTSECAIAGGVNLIVDPVHYMRLSSMSMISSSDKCKSFGNGADGFVDGEGVGAIVLKPLDKAIESGDNIYGIIKGSMINSGGKTSGYTVPNPKAQSILVLEALKNSGVNVRNITYVEAHGTGTVLGDPIEIAGLTNAFSKDTDCKQFCSIGSVKSNIGHLESAAGIAGITKIILQLKEGKIAASINSEEINPNINFEETPFILQRELSEWKRPIIDENGISKEYPRTAIISSFGAGGANANIVIEEYMSKDSEEKDLEAAYKEIVILSAKYDDRLKKKAKQLLKFIEDNKLSDKDLRKIVYTLQVGREAMDERLGLIVVSIKDLREKLLDFIEDKESLNGIYRDSIKNNRDFVKSFNIDDNFNNNTNQWIRNKQYENILELWVKGIKFDWNKLYEDKKPKRISLPTYPFKKESYWLNESVEDRSKKDSTKVMTKDTNNENCEVIFQEPFWKEEKIIREHAIYGYHVVMLDEDLARYEADIRNSTNASECIILKNNYEGIYNSFTNCFMEIFNKLKSMLKSKLKEKTLVQIVIPFSTEKNILTAITGLLKTAKLENPLLIAQIIQVDKNLKDIGNIINENVYSSSVQIKYVNEKRFVKFFKEIETECNKEELLWRDNGVYLITGGAGKLGMIFAKEIASKVKNPVIILTGRSELREDKDIKNLQDLGAKIRYEKVDISDKKSVFSLIKMIKSEYSVLNGIIHAAGVIYDNFIINKNEEEICKVLAPKVQGLVNIDEATKDFNLDFLVLFSSGSGVYGNLGQSDYSSANAFMDEYSEYRSKMVRDNKRSGKTVSINWPLWQDGGMQIDEETQKILKDNNGVSSMETSIGIKAFYKAFSLGASQVMVLNGDLQKMRKVFNIKPIKKINNGKNEELKELIIEKLKIIFSEESKVKVSLIDSNESLENYGIDSIFIIKMNEKLKTVFGDELSKTLLYEYKTIQELADYFFENYLNECKSWCGVSEVDEYSFEGEINKENIILNLKNQSEEGITTKIGTNKDENINDKVNEDNIYESIAIIGMSGRYPKAKNIREYWQRLKNKENCIGEIPKDRWNIDDFYTDNKQEAVLNGKSYCKYGGFIEGFSNFDPLLFNISPREASSIDPQERLFLESCWEVIEDSGYTKEQLASQYDGNVGVFVGITKTGFNLYNCDLWKRNKYLHLNTSFSSVANRISYLLDLHGPSMPIDTMCSSSLTAIHEACEHIRREECEMAIAGGVNLYLHPSSYVDLSSKQMLSTTGECRSFGDGGDGFVPGEGVGAILLKPLSKAIKDKDHIYAVIRGTGINHGGRTSGYTVPDPISQSKVIRKTLDKAGINAREVSYIEAHGTGTALGDPIEITGLTKSFLKDTTDVQFCSIGSVKSNIGHLEAAAGIAAVTKVVLQMENKQITPSLHSEVLNPNINFEKTPFIVQQNLEDWKRPIIEVNGEMKECPRIAGISAFGAGGANAHIIIEEYSDEQVNKEKNSKPSIIVLSAKNKEALKKIAAKLIKEISDNKLTDVNLVNAAYTLQVGRKAMEERMGVKVSSVKELKEKLEQFIGDNIDINGIYTGTVKNNKEVISILNEDKNYNDIIDIFISKNKHNDIIKLWVKGMNVYWNKLYSNNVPYKISLPTYPFMEESYWIKIDEDNYDSKKDMEKTLTKIHKNEEIVSEDKKANIITQNKVIKEIEKKDIPIVKKIEVKQKNINKPSKIELVSLGSDFSFKGSYMPKKRDKVKLIYIDEILEKNVIKEETDIEITEQVKLVDKNESNKRDISIENELLVSLAEFLGINSEDIGMDTSFIDLGLDSIIGVEWINLINKKYDLNISATKVYNYPNIFELSKFINNKLIESGKSISLHENNQQTKLQSELESEVICSQNIEDDLSEKLRRSLADFLIINIEDIDTDINFMKLGLDSIIGVEWIHLLNKKYGLTIPATKIYDYPTINQFSEFLKEEIIKGNSGGHKREQFIDNKSLDLEKILLQVENGRLDAESANNMFNNFKDEFNN